MSADDLVRKPVKVIIMRKRSCFGRPPERRCFGEVVAAKGLPKAWEPFLWTVSLLWRMSRCRPVCRVVFRQDLHGTTAGSAWREKRADDYFMI